MKFPPELFLKAFLLSIVPPVSASFLYYIILYNYHIYIPERINSLVSLQLSKHRYNSDIMWSSITLYHSLRYQKFVIIDEIVSYNLSTKLFIQQMVNMSLILSRYASFFHNTNIYACTKGVNNHLKGMEKDSSFSPRRNRREKERKEKKRKKRIEESIVDRMNECSIEVSSFIPILFFKPQSGSPSVPARTLTDTLPWCFMMNKYAGLIRRDPLDTKISRSETYTHI